MAESYSAAEKKRFLTLSYFGVSDNPGDDVNPYTNLVDFSSATVGSLRWGVDLDVRKRSKMRFADAYHRVLDIYHIELAYTDILSALHDENRTNDAVVDGWVGTAVFPAKI